MVKKTAPKCYVIRTLPFFLFIYEDIYSTHSYISVKFIHAPVISLTAKKRFTDTTNAYRAYSKRYITHPDVQPFRDIFMTYELLAYLSVKASRLGLKTCEIPVMREYPKNEKTPTKIKGFRGNSLLLKILCRNAIGRYNV
jgi:dolichol-phosphate mannosyltransferase